MKNPFIEPRSFALRLQLALQLKATTEGRLVNLGGNFVGQAQLIPYLDGLEGMGYRDGTTSCDATGYESSTVYTLEADLRIVREHTLQW